MVISFSRASNNRHRLPSFHLSIPRFCKIPPAAVDRVQRIDGIQQTKVGVAEARSVRRQGVATQRAFSHKHVGRAKRSAGLDWLTRAAVLRRDDRGFWACHVLIWSLWSLSILLQRPVVARVPGWQADSGASRRFAGAVSASERRQACARGPLEGCCGTGDEEVLRRKQALFARAKWRAIWGHDATVGC